MNKEKTIQISDTIHGSIRLNSIEKQVISTPIFNRLHNISQNSTVYLTFPTNRTKRFEHSIGTMDLCGKMFINSISNADKETLTNFFCNYNKIILLCINDKLNNYADKYRSKIGDSNLTSEKLKGFYHKINISGEYNSYIPTNVENQYKNVYVILLQSVRLGALLHDVGHPPFSHITENSLNEIWGKLKEITDDNLNEKQREFIECMKIYIEKGQDLHEEIGNIITEKILYQIINNISNKEKDNGEVISQQLFKILVCEITTAILQEKNKIFGELHRLIDGTLDGDRLDYVSRDPINSGLNVGLIEYDRIITSMRLVSNENDFLFSPSSKVIEAIEDFFNRRWRMYKQIIYHHRVIKTDYLLQSCIKELALKYLNEKSDKPYEKHISEILPYDISGLWKAVKGSPSNNAFFYQLIQWDDGWLMTILKKYYFEMKNGENCNTLYKLEELLANSKYYYSLIKRMDDFTIIDKEIVNAMQEMYSPIDLLIKNIKSDETLNNGNIVIEIQPILDYITKLNHLINSYNRSDNYLRGNGFILTKIIKIFNNIFEDGWFNEIIDESVNKIKMDMKEIRDIIIIVKKIKTGIQGGANWAQGGLGLYSINKQQISIRKFLDSSNEGNKLEEDTNYMPVFYMYVLKEDEEYLDYDKIKQEIGKNIGINMANRVKEKLEELNVGN